MGVSRCANYHHNFSHKHQPHQHPLGIPAVPVLVRPSCPCGQIGWSSPHEGVHRNHLRPTPQGPESPESPARKSAWREMPIFWRFVHGKINENQWQNMGTPWKITYNWRCLSSGQSSNVPWDIPTCHGNDGRAGNFIFHPPMFVSLVTNPFQQASYLPNGLVEIPEKGIVNWLVVEPPL